MSDELKPCPFCGGSPQVNQSPDAAWWWVQCLECDAAPVAEMETRERTFAAWNTRALDEVSYRAGLEAAAKLFEDQAKLSSDAAWSEQLCEMAGEIRALPTPSTLPQEGKP